MTWMIALALQALEIEYIPMSTGVVAEICASMRSVYSEMGLRVPEWSFVWHDKAIAHIIDARIACCKTRLIETMVDQRNFLELI